jgi:DNA 3'-phosphatase
MGILFLFLQRTWCKTRINFTFYLQVSCTEHNKNMDKFLVKSDKSLDISPPLKKARVGSSSSDERRELLASLALKSLSHESGFHVLPSKAHDKWWEYKGAMYKFSGPVSTQWRRMIAFDLDGTIITTKSGKVWAVNDTDWKLWDPSVKTTLQQLHHENCYLAIISNQKGVETKAVSKESIQKKIDLILNLIGVPMDVICAVSDDVFRKPCTGMWDTLFYNRFYPGMCSGICSTEDSPILKKSSDELVVVPFTVLTSSVYRQSLYVGDAAGRLKVGTTRKDFADTDYKMALNAGVQVRIHFAFVVNFRITLIFALNLKLRTVLNTRAVLS